MFPDTDEANRGRDSGQMLQIARDRVLAAGYEIINVDCIVFAQQPKLSAYKNEIRRQIAELLKIEPGSVGVKAKTGEGVGTVGRQEAIQAECVALLHKHAP